jgi:hypothetical protein
MIENVAKLAFPTLSHDDVSLLFNDIYVYTASVCDIILNPDHPYTECSKKPKDVFENLKCTFYFFC